MHMFKFFKSEGISVNLNTYFGRENLKFYVLKWPIKCVNGEITYFITVHLTNTASQVTFSIIDSHLFEHVVNISWH